MRKILLENMKQRWKKQSKPNEKEGAQKHVCRDTPLDTHHRVNRHLSRCHPKWRQAQGEGDWEDFHCKDFIALCYCQLIHADKTKISTCPVCDRRILQSSGSGRPRLFCSTAAQDSRYRRHHRQYNILWQKYVTRARPEPKGRERENCENGSTKKRWSVSRRALKALAKNP